MLDLGTVAPDFQLPEPATGKIVTRTDFTGKPLLVIFICNHCPYVVLIRETLVQVAKRLMDQGVAVVAINANDEERYPDDSPARMVEDVKSSGYPFPYLFDKSQRVALAYQAACTPDLYLFDATHRLFYRGQFDTARPGNGITPTGKDILEACNALLSGQPPPLQQLPSMGCNIKWRPGNEPDYYGHI